MATARSFLQGLWDISIPGQRMNAAAEARAQREAAQAQREREAQTFEALRSGDPNAVAALDPNLASNLQGFQTAQEAEFRDAGLRFARGAQQLVNQGVPVEEAFDALAQRAGGLFGDPEELAEVREFVVSQGPAGLQAMEAALRDDATVARPSAAIQNIERYKQLQAEDPTLANTFLDFVRAPKVTTEGGRVARLRAGEEALTTLQTPETTAAGEQTVAAGKEGGKVAAQDMAEAFTQAEQAEATLAQAQRAKELLGEGVITGSLANQRLAMSRALSLVTGSEISPEATSTAEYRAIVGQFVGQAITAFGAGTGLSDKDREFAEAMAGGDLAAGAKALRDIIEIVEEQADRKIDNYERRRERVVSDAPSAAKLYPSLREQPEAEEISLEEYMRGGQ